MIRRPPAATPEPWSFVAGLLALALCLQALMSSWLWLFIGGAVGANYAAVRKSSGFRGMPIEEIRVALDRRLPVQTAIRLGPRFAANDQWAQRLKEGIYPRRVEEQAAVTLELGATPSLAQTPQGGVGLVGSLPPAPPPPPVRELDLGLSWGRVVVHLVAVFGWGAVVALFLDRLRRRRDVAVPLGPAAALAAPVLLGVLATAATVLQRPLPWTALKIVGFVLAVAVPAVSIDRRQLGAQLRRGLTWTRHLETWAVLLLGAVLIWHMAIWPIIGWDGRSIWLYRAKMLAWNGFVPAADAANLQNYFSHMEYPLLFPSWLAFFGTSGPLREREIGVAVMMLQMALLASVWWLSRRRLGRWTGAAFAGTLFVVAAAQAERGYADGFVTMYLVCGMLAVDDEPLEPFGWLALLGTMLTKSEGLIFAIMAGTFLLLLLPRLRARRWLARLAPALLLLPSLAQSAWTHAVGVKSQYAGAHLPALGAVMGRLQVIWNGMAKCSRESVAIAFLPAALGCYVVLEAMKRTSEPARAAALTGVGIVAFIVGVMLVTPYDLVWHVDTAVGRLLLHSVFASLLAVLVALVPPPSSQPAAVDSGPA